MSDLIHFFPGMGWRPAIWITHRDQYGDKPLLIVGDDSPLLVKYDAPVDPFQPVEGIGLGAVVYARVEYPDGGTSTGGGASGKWSPPLFPDWPTITHPCCGEPWVPHEPPIVPVPASGALMLACIAALILCRGLFQHDHPGSGWVGHDSAMPRGGYDQ